MSIEKLLKKITNATSRVQTLYLRDEEPLDVKRMINPPLQIT